MKTIAVVLIGVLLAFNLAQAGVKFIPKEGKLWVKASGELVILKTEKTKEEYLALKIEDSRRYILTGGLSAELKKLLGGKIEVEGLLRERIGLAQSAGQEAFPSIEVKSVREIVPRGEK